MSIRIAWHEAGMNLELEENRVLVITIENTRMYVKFISDLSAQSRGIPGSVHLSRDDKPLLIGKSAEIIFNPFLLDVNNKRALTKLYQELSCIEDDMFQEQQHRINAGIIGYLDALAERCAYHVEYDLQMDSTALYKLYNIKLADNADSFLERLIDYLKVMSRLCGINIFIFVNLKDYMEKDELEALYEIVRYEKIDLILLETRETFHHKGEKHWILDKDRCIIDTDELTM